MAVRRDEKEVHLNLDDTGSRKPDLGQSEAQFDHMDCFGLGGVLIEKDRLGCVQDSFETFRGTWKLTCPLHSHSIRHRRKRLQMA